MGTPSIGETDGPAPTDTTAYSFSKSDDLNSGINEDKSGALSTTDTTGGGGEPPVSCPGVDNYWNSSTNSCENCDTSSGYNYWNSGNNSCDYCDTGSGYNFWDSNNNICEYCDTTSGDHWDSTNNICVPCNTALGDTWDSNSNSCVDVCGGCTSGQYCNPNNSTCTVIPTCSEPYPNWSDYWRECQSNPF